MSRILRSPALVLAAAALVVAAAWAVARTDPERLPTAPTIVVTRPPSLHAGGRSTRGPRRGGRTTTRVALTPASVAPSAPTTTAPFARPTVFRRAGPARGGAVPRSVHVLRVPVPRSLPAREQVRWTMRPGPRAEVLSAYAGTITPQTPDSDRAITIVTRIPARAAAGILPVGEAEFIADSVSIVVPIELVIERVRRASILPSRPTYGALAGQKLLLGIEVRNLGNSPDTVSIVADVPVGWSRIIGQRVALIPGERRVVTFETKVPQGAGSTAAYPAFRALMGDSVVALATVPVQVEDPAERDRPVGPQLTVGSSTAFGDSVASSPAFDFALSGAVANGVAVIGRASFALDEATLDRRALARAGAYLGGAFISIRGPGWYGTAGNTGTTLSSLTGIGAFGRGVTGGGARGPASMTGMVADVPNGTGVQAGGRADYQIKRSTIGVAASHFADAGASGRGLDAVGLIGSTNPGAGFRLSAEAAWRQYDGGSGAGVALGVERNTDKDLLSVMFAHAPGGSQAYGRALSDVSAVWGRRFSDRVALQTNMFSSVDRPPRAGGEFKANGWAVGPRYAIRPDLSAELEVRRNSFESQNVSGGGFASTDMTTSAALRKVGGRTMWTAGASVGSTKRTTTLSSGTAIDLTAQRYGISAGAAVILPRMVLSGGADYSRSGTGSGFAPRQARLTLGASRIAPFSSPRAPIFRAEAEITSWFGDQPSTVVARIGTELPLPGEFSLVVDAERNPLIRPAGDRTPWIVALRLERGFSLGWAVHTPMTRGTVFQDRNGNGVRDSDEQGLAGVMIRRGSQTAVTDGSGRFALQGTDPVPLEVDPVSLPAGVVAPSMAQGHGAQTLAFGVVPTGAVAVRLVPVLDELGRRPESPFSDLAVLARDDRGAEWYLRADSTGLVRFDALPPGRYTFVPDFAGTTERLRQTGDAVILEVKPGENLPPLEVRFTVRPARLFNGGQGQTDQGRRRR
ncbi:MAG: hypothetical protein ABIQ41_08015 [Gemmatimonadales bacterium]